MRFNSTQIVVLKFDKKFVLKIFNINIKWAFAQNFFYCLKTAIEYNK